VRTDLGAIETIGRALEGSGRPSCSRRGPRAGARPRRNRGHAIRPKRPPADSNAVVALGLAQRWVRVSFVRLSPTVHGKGDHGFMKSFIDIARKKGVSGYVGDGRIGGTPFTGSMPRACFVWRSRRRRRGLCFTRSGTRVCRRGRSRRSLEGGSAWLRPPLHQRRPTRTLASSAASSRSISLRRARSPRSEWAGARRSRG